jgi:hypothetical protein
MKTGDLVRDSNHEIASANNWRTGFIMQIEKDYYGASQALKIYKPVARGQAIRSDMVDGIGPTRDGIRDRVLVFWNGNTVWEYCESTELEVISEGR